MIIVSGSRLYLRPTSSSLFRFATRVTVSTETSLPISGQHSTSSSDPEEFGPGTCGRGIPAGTWTWDARRAARSFLSSRAWSTSRPKLFQKKYFGGLFDVPFGKISVRSKWREQSREFRVSSKLSFLRSSFLHAIRCCWLLGNFTHERSFIHGYFIIFFCLASTSVSLLKNDKAWCEISNLLIKSSIAKLEFAQHKKHNFIRGSYIKNH